MSAPIITLTTDFGTRDPWVGIMKGVMLRICPEARLVDLSHDIAPQDVLEGALCLEAAAAFFPAGTVHLAVVDPGVGSSRRPLALRTGGQCYVGPDNGLLSLVFEGGAPVDAVELTGREYRLSPTSRTFHGRDIFAPAAAHLASGVPLERLGPLVVDPVKLALPSGRHEDGIVGGEVIGVDRFGNLLTSVTEGDLAALPGSPRLLDVEIDGIRVGTLVSAYSEAPPGGMGAVVGSTGRLEIFVREGSARSALGLGRGAPVTVRRS